MANIEGGFNQRQAAYLLNEAIERGRLTRPDKCELCNSEGVIYAHHAYGYDRPYDVWFICNHCNIKLSFRHDGSLTRDQAREVVHKFDKYQEVGNSRENKRRHAIKTGKLKRGDTCQVCGDKPNPKKVMGYNRRTNERQEQIRPSIFAFEFCENLWWLCWRCHTVLRYFRGPDLTIDKAKKIVADNLKNT